MNGTLVLDTTAYDLYRFNQSAAKEWENYKAHSSDFSLVNGQGYLYATKATQTLVFMGDAFNMGTAPVKVPLGHTEGKPLTGWNLVGNPFTVDAYVNRSFYTMNDEGTGLIPNAITDYQNTTIAPCTGIVVQATGVNDTITFSTTAPTQQSAGGNNGSLNIALSQVVEPIDPSLRGTKQSSIIDNAIITFSDGSELGKFYFGEQDANIYIPQGNEDYAIAYSDTQGEMPLNFKAHKSGEYTLTISAPLTSNFSTLTLIDNLTGANIDLLQTPSYTFTARTDDYASRFKLVFNGNNNDIDPEGNDDFAFIDGNGNIIVNGEGMVQIIDVTGRILVERKDAARHVSTANMTPGVYMLRLINGENIKTQKIVVK